MDERVGKPAEIKSVLGTTMDNLNRKRKLQDELLSLPLSKHVCWDQSQECDSSSDSTAEQLKWLEGDKFTRGGESDSDSAKDSNSFDSYSDSIMSTRDEAKTDRGYQEARTSDEPSTSSVSWGVASSEIGPCSSESRSLTKPGFSETESLSISEQPLCPYHHCALPSPLNYEGHLQDFEVCADCSCLEYRNDGIEQYTDKELKNLLHSSGVAPGDCGLSPGRWSVSQDARQGSKKLTIDKEFEQYFSLLML